MLRACKIVAHSGANFVKTGTGWIPGGANLERIPLIKSHYGNDLKAKAAGGIRTQEDFLKLVDMGVERMGINTYSAVEIARSLPH